jgi:hypothetical protein
MKIFTLFLVLIMVVGCATVPPNATLPMEKTKKTLHHKTWSDKDTTKSPKSSSSDEENFKHNYVHTGYM